MNLTKAQKKKLEKSAIEIDAVYVEYVCPNNRTNGRSDGHFYRVNASEILSMKKRPKCPYCGAKTKMIDYDKIRGDSKKPDKPEKQDAAP